MSYEESKIVRVYDSARMKIYRTAYFYFDSMKTAMIMHVNEQEEIHRAFVTIADSAALAV
jgi:hypothetical protein